MHWTMLGTRRGLGSVASAQTDDRGSFVLSVQPGEYVISATSPQVRTAPRQTGATGRYVFRPTFYPESSTFAGGVVLAVKAGDDRSGLALRMPLQPAFRVRGVLNALDAGKMPARIQLSADNDLPRLYASAVDPQGRFIFDNIPPGRYVVENLRTQFPASDPAVPADLWARAIVDVTDKDLDITVDVHRKLLVSGRVEFAGGSQLPSDSGLLMTVNLIADNQLPSDFGVAGIPVGPDGRFTMATFPGRVVVSGESATRDPRAAIQSGTLQATRYWYLRSALHDGRDVAASPLVVTSDVWGLVLTFTDQPPTLSGRVTSRQGSVESAYLLIFPDEERLWVDYGFGRRVQVRTLPRDGTFTTTLPEGDYLAIAIRTAASDRDLKNPVFLQSLVSQAKRVGVREGATSTQDLELVSVAPPNAALAPLPVRFEMAERAAVRDVPATATGGATISGVILAAGSKQPLASARVGLTTDTPFGATGGAYTDERGQFVLTDVPAGQHTLYVSKPSFASTVYGAARPGEPGTPVSVSAGQSIRGLAIELVKGAAIGGTVLDQNGQPFRGAQVSVRAYRWTARGREPVVSRGPGLTGSGTTDARGEYRLYGLAPGDYIVQVISQGATTPMPLTTRADVDAAAGAPRAAGSQSPTARAPVSYVPLFYPNTIDPARALAMTLAAGDDRTIDFQFTLTPTATVAGIVRTAGGAPLDRLSVQLTQSDPLAPTIGGSRFATVEPDGTFKAQGVAPGRYTLTTSQLSGGGSILAAGLEFFVDGDVAGLVVDAVPVGKVAGRIVGDVPSAARQINVRISLVPLPGTIVPPNQNRSSIIGADNRFSIANVPPGRYRLELTGPNNIVKPRVSSQIVNGVETSDAGLQVTSGEEVDVAVELTTSEAQVSGGVRDRAGQPVTRPYVLLFAKEPTAWTPPSRRIFGLRPDQNGRYLFPDVPAGDYLITILTDVESGEWFNPATLATLASIASPVTVRRGDKLDIDLETR
jgi:hypothetical protein